MTPVVLQKVQPVVAVLAAMVVLGERPRSRYSLYFATAIAGTWLMGVPHPFHPQAHGLTTMAYALGAAVLWALGTVFGRYLARDMRFEHVTTLRFAFGLAGCRHRAARPRRPRVLARGTTRSGSRYSRSSPGLAAMFIYYYGLRWTPAVLATIAELAYPVAAILIGYFKFGQTLTGWQWVGVAVTSMVVALLPARPRDTVDPAAAAAPQPA